MQELTLQSLLNKYLDIDGALSKLPIGSQGHLLTQRTLDKCGALIDNALDKLISEVQLEEHE